MDLPEIVDLIIYFTENPVSELSLVSKYWNENVKKIRITSNKDYPNMEDNHLLLFPNLTELDLSIDFKAVLATFNENFKSNNFDPENVKLPKLNISKLYFGNLSNLKSLNLSYNFSITGLSKLTNLTELTLEGNNAISNDGISTLTNLTFLNLNGCLHVREISMLTNLTFLNLSHKEDISTDNIWGQLPKLSSYVSSNGEHIVRKKRYYISNIISSK